MDIPYELIVTSVISLFIGVIAPSMWNRWMAQRDGRQAREKAGWISADAEARERRKWETWGHRVLMVAIRHGFDHLLPPTPGQPGGPQSWDSSGSIIEPPRSEE